MSLSDFILDKLDPQDILTEYSLANKKEAFQKTLMSWTIWLINRPDDREANNSDELLNQIMNDVAKLKNDDFRPWIIKDNERIIIPVFSSQNIAQKFIANLVRETNDLKSVGMVGVAGEFLYSLNLTEVQVVLNYKTDKVTGLNRVLQRS